MTTKKYTVILNDANKTVIYTNSLTAIKNGKEVAKYPASARVINNETIQPRAEVVEEQSEFYVVDTTPYHKFQEFLREMFQLENALVAEMGREYRLRNPVLYYSITI